MANGFNPNNYEGILELGQSAPNSLSRFLREYRQYLLSRQVQYHELEQFGIDGAFGYLESEGILVPKTLGNDDHFLYNAPKVPYRRHSYSYPSIDEFGAIICEGINSTDVNEVCWHDLDSYIGYCKDFADERELRLYRNSYNHTLQFISCVVGRDYEMIKDKDSQRGKEYCLIRRKK